MRKMIPEDGSSSVSSSSLQMFSLISLSPSLGSPYQWLREMRSEERGLCLIHLLVACANHVASGSIENANIGLEYISHLASPDGDTIQRIASYFAEALAERILKSWPGLHKALNSMNTTSPAEELLVQKLFFEFCPFLKLSYVITNQAILEAMEGEKVVHIIDLCCYEPVQWINLIHALSTRPEGSPHLRITGIHEHKEVLDQMARRLNEEAEKLDIPFQFHPVVSKLENLDFERLHVKTGEAVAVSSVLQLHTLLAADDEFIIRNSQNFQHRVLQSSVSPDSSSSSPIANKLSSFLSSLWGLSPKLVVVTEQESNHSGLTLMGRIMESLNFYAALFDCLESTFPSSSVDRHKIEKMLYGKEIKNIISCEGAGRRTRHEKLEQWIPRFEFSGFCKFPSSSNALLQARRLLHSYSYDGYKVKEENGFLFICWQDQPLFSVSAWRMRR